MLVDRRRSARLACKRLAKIQFDYGYLPRDCMITDVSESGVKVFMENYDVPLEFTIIFSTGLSCRCHLGWRNGYEFGAEFIDRSRLAPANWRLNSRAA
jgi:PilZ domain-containing protein